MFVKGQRWRRRTPYDDIDAAFAVVSLLQDFLAGGVPFDDLEVQMLELFRLFLFKFFDQKTKLPLVLGVMIAYVEDALLLHLTCLHELIMIVTEVAALVREEFQS